MPVSSSSPKIVVVGPCASGKSTLVGALQKHGYDAFVCAQEHSAIPKLFRHQNPDLVVMLEVDLDHVRLRRTPSWSETIYGEQQKRLATARSEADLVIDTGVSGEQETLDSVLGAIKTWNPTS